MRTLFCNFLILIFITSFNNKSFAKEYDEEIEREYNKNSFEENFIQKKEKKSIEELIYYPLYSKIHDEHIPENRSILELGITDIGVGFSREVQGKIFNKNFEYQNIQLLNDPILFLNAKFSDIYSNIYLTINLGYGLVKFLDLSNYETENSIKYSQHRSASAQLELDFKNFTNKLEFSYIGKKINTEDIVPWFNFLNSTTTSIFNNFWTKFLSGAFNAFPNLEKRTDNTYSENIIKASLSSSYNIHLLTSNIGSIYLYLGGNIGLLSSLLTENKNSFYSLFMPIVGIKYQNNFSVFKIGNNLIELSFNLSI